ncbi:MAG: hypothetical protein IPN95_15725 [Bacteroidetes bacterium]|nr:hypothetical protein [Bacteroidota bacterium]MBP6721069.1 hypothetical protein [Bacteroidia bacterium]
MLEVYMGLTRCMLLHRIGNWLFFMFKGGRMMVRMSLRLTTMLMRWMLDL